jgi:hypothetical protein
MKVKAMTQSRICRAGVTLGLLLLLATPLQAQRYDVGQRPVLSPWFGLYQRNNGPLDNYHTYVRPELELNDTLDRQQAGIERNTTGIKSLGQDVTQMQRPQTVHPTGAASVFMDYSHYYPSRMAGSNARPAVRARPSTSMPRPVLR